MSSRSRYLMLSSGFALAIVVTGGVNTADVVPKDVSEARNDTQVMATYPSSSEALGYEVSRHCAIDENDAFAILVKTDPNLLDTSWLPSHSEFEMASNIRPEKTVWNRLSKGWLNVDQLNLLGMAYTIGYKDGGETQAKLVQAVLLQETIAGLSGRLGDLSAPFGKRSYGVMQVKVVAARDVLHLKPELGEFNTDDQLISRLMSDDEFNIRIASAYLTFLRIHTGRDDSALAAYNIGLNAAQGIMNVADYKYVKNIERYIVQVVNPYNTKFSSGIAVRIASSHL